MKKSQYGPCGLFCGACGATDCGGCQSEDIDDWVRRCTFRNCTRHRNVEFCCFCGDYPCKEIHDFMNDEWPHHWTMESNLEFIKAHSGEEWLRAQQQEWTCKSCGADIVWYQKECSCGKHLDAFDLPELPDA